MTYMQETGTVTTEIEMKAIEYINAGYQKILTFECADGGFNWWEGDNPGNAILSALAIMMLTDTLKVYDTIDTAVIDRTADYLASVQKSDGSWSEDTHLHAGNENLGAGSLRASCYITWGLAYGGYDIPAVTKAVSYIKSKLPAEDGAYTRAMCLNALLAAGDNSALVTDGLKDFHDEAILGDGTVHWSADGDTLVNSGGNAAEVEITSLVALAMAQKGSFTQDINGAVEWLVQSKDPQGNWGYNTQATVLALKVFVKALTMNPGQTDADISIFLNGEKMASKHFDNFNKDVVFQVEATSGLPYGDNTVELEYAGTGALSYQIIGTHYVPWEEADMPEGPLSINVGYDTTTVNVDDIITATVTITNNNESAKGMVLVTVGLPPGFTLVTQDLASLQAEGIISSFEVMGKQLVLYFAEIPAGEPTSVSYSLIADYPIKAQTGGSEAKYYYDSQVKGEEESQEIEVLP
jgi:alpha-2-macroglobulin-like protein